MKDHPHNDHWSDLCEAVRAKFALKNPQLVTNPSHDLMDDPSSDPSKLHALSFGARYRNDAPLLTPPIDPAYDYATTINWAPEFKQKFPFFSVNCGGVYSISISFVTLAKEGEVDDDVYMALMSRPPHVSDWSVVGYALKGEQAYPGPGNNEKVPWNWSRIGASVTFINEFFGTESLCLAVTTDGYSRFRLAKYDFAMHRIGQR